MEVLTKPDSASTVVDKIDERKVHLGIRFLSKTRLLYGSDRFPPCTVSGHEPFLLPPIRTLRKWFGRKGKRTVAYCDWKTFLVQRERNSWRTY